MSGLINLLENTIDNLIRDPEAAGIDQELIDELQAALGGLLRFFAWSMELHIVEQGGVQSIGLTYKDDQEDIIEQECYQFDTSQGLDIKVYGQLDNSDENIETGWQTIPYIENQIEDIKPLQNGN